MSKIALEGNASGTGTFTIAGPNTNTNYTITLPQETGTLFTTGATTGLNGSAISTGTVAANVGGTGATTLTAENVVIGNGTSAVKFVAPGTTGNVLTSNGSAWLSQAAAAGGGDYIMQVYTSPATWTKPAGLKAVKVTVVGGGGNGGNGDPGCGGLGGNGGNGGGALRYIDAPAIPGPISVTVGGAAGTSSFGPLASATGGGNGGNGTSGAPGGTGGGGSGSGGTLNMTGMAAAPASNPSTFSLAASFGFGGGHNVSSSQTAPGSKAGNVYGGGGTGGSNGGSAPTIPGGAGAGGIVIVEEFY